MLELLFFGLGGVNVYEAMKHKEDPAGERTKQRRFGLFCLGIGLVLIAHKLFVYYN